MWQDLNNTYNIACNPETWCVTSRFPCYSLSANMCFFSLYVFGKPAAHFSKFSSLSPLTEVSPQPCAIPGGNPPDNWQSAIGWGDTGSEPGTAGQQSGALPLSHHASPIRQYVHVILCSHSLLSNVRVMIAKPNIYYANVM
jgi:hypothetical protein